MRRNKYSANRVLQAVESSFNGRFPCGHCDKDYATQENLAKHIQLKHAEVDEEPDVIGCLLCDQEFTSEELHLEHLELDHDGVDSDSVNEE